MALLLYARPLPPPRMSAPPVDSNWTESALKGGRPPGGAGRLGTHNNNSVTTAGGDLTTAELNHHHLDSKFVLYGEFWVWESRHGSWYAKTRRKLN